MNVLFDTSRRARRQWSQMVSGGLRKDASAAESLVLNSVREWAQEAGMNLSQLNPGPTETEKGFYRITLRAKGSGKMSDIGRFLYRIETASVI